MANREYLEAIVNETLPQYYLDKLLWYQLYSDDLPRERSVDIWHPDFPMMKCRGSVITSIDQELGGGVNDRVIKSSEVIDRVRSYREYDWNFRKGANREFWTSPEEIDLINNTLIAVIAYLKQEYILSDNINSIKQRFQEVLIQRRKVWDV